MSHTSLLYGKRVSEEDLAKEVTRLLLGDSNRKIPPKNPTEICKALGFSSRQTFYRYKKIAIERGLLQVAENGKVEKRQATVEEEFRDYTENNPFVQDLLVHDWLENLKVRRTGGKARVAWKTIVKSLESVCNTCKVKPEQLLVDRKNTEKILQNFKAHYENRNVPKQYVQQAENSTNPVHTRVMAVRDFCGFHGMSWPRGTSGIMSGRILGHAKYSDIRFNDEDFDKAENYIIKKFGLDSDFFREYTMGIDSGARALAILGIKLEWEERINKKGKTKFYMQAFESKTSHIKEGKWLKIISNPALQESLRLAKARGWNSIYDPKKIKNTEYSNLKKNLRDLYTFLGKTKPYFFKRPVHALRHIAAQRYLKKYKWNLGVVAKLIGSNVIDELKNSYGEMPPEILDEILEEYESLVTSRLSI